MTSEKRTRITVLGLGRMGSAIAGRYLAAGYPTTVWNRTPGRAPQLDELGARRAATLADAIAASELIIVSHVDTPGVAALLDTVPGALAGRTVLNVSTGRPDDARALAVRIAEQQGHFLDGAILGMPATVGTAATLVPYSGSAEAADAHGAAIAELGATTYLGADTGLAALHDMAVLAGMYGLFGGFFHAAAMLGGAPATVHGLTADFLVPWLRALLDVLPALAAEIDADEFAPTFASIAEMGSVLDTIRGVSREQGVPTDLLDPLQRLLDVSVERGLGADNFPRAATVLRDHTVAA
ncbi:NAD(P)-dependent oxidoreductase [Nocardia brasiliensis]|uniref:NAD(P)-dependent oxidoreductase n=1 Tax=Nocardia brasiliensis TaxID=37326 RepID=UPI00189390CC|nr:NAD(P)-binding domain-containing protein [Nocardia brasiliensis]MBF6545032.1 NAD(P)-dependent oxidoreductase [Nocardia brasiliensis]